MKTKEQIAAYNKEYFSRPEVIARAKERNAQPYIKERRKLYKKTVDGRFAENTFRRKNWARNRDLRDRSMYKRYGIHLLDYEYMYLLQNGLCLICDKHEDVLHIDHCHTTKKVRGLLCGSCNRALGLLKDNVNFLVKAIAYLAK